MGARVSNKVAADVPSLPAGNLDPENADTSEIISEEADEIPNSDSEEFALDTEEMPDEVGNILEVVQEISDTRLSPDDDAEETNAYLADDDFSDMSSVERTESEYRLTEAEMHSTESETDSVLGTELLFAAEHSTPSLVDEPAAKRVSIDNSLCRSERVVKPSEKLLSWKPELLNSQVAACGPQSQMELEDSASVRYEERVTPSGVMSQPAESALRSAGDSISESDPPPPFLSGLHL
ncbi:hypothetical protein COEREDRAFT_10444 [Coemansia reversa NRRL 1564]|uniref:Uncharacterized protein n=1 Tax=Coemansia reversa (strain ATCC 12441 / NRRL 1564) TaxID=763665 RepID=A0A2G5B5W5_COERN|nr:hypothetical protein COEREDRAFT_10444 [Coemansia reversa NRRL 1564]|eukprot:PIA14392.1 hypothetical protein COEREDRAFT_10444 [Coemansia reversa NRRL 1564]